MLLVSIHMCNDDYKYDLFISYCRGYDTRKWIEKQFLERLKGRLSLDLGRPPRIFYDENNLQCGDIWPMELGAALGASRALLVLWSKPFRSSIWCAREVAEMRAREEVLNLRTPQNRNGLIAITQIHNGPPDAFGEIQYSDLEPYYNPDMGEGTPLAERFYDRLKIESVSLAKMIENAPPFDPNWSLESAEAMFEAFHLETRPQQNISPSFTGSRGGAER